LKVVEKENHGVVMREKLEESEEGFTGDPWNIFDRRRMRIRADCSCGTVLRKQMLENRLPWAFQADNRRRNPID
jgi:hypothetical protein